MYRLKELFGGHLTLRHYDAQIGEMTAMIHALNKMTRADMPERVRIAGGRTNRKALLFKSDLFTKAVIAYKTLNISRLPKNIF